MGQSTISADETDPREPTVRCDRCGKLGVIARATRHSDPALILRYCATCWPVASEELEARLQAEHDQRRHSPNATPAPPGWTTSSRSWHDVTRFLDLIAQSAKGGKTPSHEELASIAAEIQTKAAEFSGEMPAEVAVFIRLNSPPAA